MTTINYLTLAFTLTIFCTVRPCLFTIDIDTHTAESDEEHLDLSYQERHHIILFNTLKKRIQSSNLNRFNISDIQRALQSIDINMTSSSGNTLLFHAAHHNRLNIIQLLLDYQADINLSNHNGITPLLAAIKNNKFPSATLLINKKASVNQADNTGCTPLLAIIDHDSEELHSTGGFLSDKNFNMLTLAQLLIDNNASVNNHAHENGATPLMAATLAISPHMVNLLLTNNAEVNARNYNNKTPLMLATEETSLTRLTYVRIYYNQIIYSLIMAKADPYAVDNSGASALDNANQHARDTILETYVRRIVHKQDWFPEELVRYLTRFHHITAPEIAALIAGYAHYSYADDILNALAKKRIKKNKKRYPLLFKRTLRNLYRT